MAYMNMLFFGSLSVNGVTKGFFVFVFVFFRLI